MTPEPEPPTPPVETMDFSITNTLNNTYVFAVVAADDYANPISGAPVYRVKAPINQVQTINAVVGSYNRFIVMGVAYNNSIPDLDDYALSSMNTIAFFKNGVSKSSFKTVDGLNVTLSFAGLSSSGNSYNQE